MSCMYCAYMPCLLASCRRALGLVCTCRERNGIGVDFHTLPLVSPSHGAMQSTESRYASQRLRTSREGLQLHHFEYSANHDGWLWHFTHVRDSLSMSLRVEGGRWRGWVGEFAVKVSSHRKWIIGGGHNAAAGLQAVAPRWGSANWIWAADGAATTAGDEFSHPRGAQ